MARVKDLLTKTTSIFKKTKYSTRFNTTYKKVLLFYGTFQNLYRSKQLYIRLFPSTEIQTSGRNNECLKDIKRVKNKGLRSLHK